MRRFATINSFYFTCAKLTGPNDSIIPLVIMAFRVTSSMYVGLLVMFMGVILALRLLGDPPPDLEESALLGLLNSTHRLEIHRLARVWLTFPEHLGRFQLLSSIVVLVEYLSCYI